MELAALLSERVFIELWEERVHSSRSHPIFRWPEFSWNLSLCNFQVATSIRHEVSRRLEFDINDRLCPVVKVVIMDLAGDLLFVYLMKMLRHGLVCDGGRPTFVETCTNVDIAYRQVRWAPR